MKLRDTFLAASVFALLPFAASAVTYSIDASTVGGDTADVFAATFGANLPLNSTGWVSGDPTVTPPPGSVNNTFQSPWSGTGLEDINSYFSVGGSNATNGSGSPNTLDLGGVKTSLQILWGSIDTYNTITFLLGGAVQDSFTGTQVCATIGCGADNGFGNFEETALITFMGRFDAIKLESGQEAFEMALAPVPVPAAGLMLLAGLGGIAALKRRKKV